MTAPTSTPLPAPATADTELAEPPFPPQLVEEFVRHFVRAAKTHQLYLPNNPIYQRSIESLRGSFTPIWEHTSELVLQISESEFKWLGRVMHHEGSKTESLPWVMYKDGLRELTILQGFETEEATVLLDILQRVRKASPDEDDLLTLLWEQEFAYLRYRFIDLAIDTFTPIEASGDATETQTVSVDELRKDASQQQENPGIVRMDSLDTTLYFLDEHEIDYLRGEVQKEQQLNPRRNVLGILFDICETQPAQEVREEICGIFEQILPSLLAAGDYSAVAHLLSEATAVADRLKGLAPDHRRRLLELPALLGQPTVLGQILQALNDLPTVPPQEELDALFSQLQGGTLGTVLRWLGQTQSRELRTTLERAAARLASANTGELIALMLDEDEDVAREAIRRAGELKTPAAVGQLLKVLGQQNVALRRAAAQALAEIGSPGALRALEHALDDDDREVRLTGVRVLSARGHRAALPKVEAVVTGRGVKDADLTEKMAYFEAYGLLAGDDGVSQLDALLNGRSALLRLRVEPELRACAAMALGKIGSEAAMAALRRAAEDKDVRVRSAINKALRTATA